MRAVKAREAMSCDQFHFLILTISHLMTEMCLCVCVFGVDGAKRTERNSGRTPLIIVSFRHSFPPFPSINESEEDKEYFLIIPCVELNWK